MRRPKRILVVMLPFFFIGVGSVVRNSEKLMSVSENVRLVNIIGLAAAGAMCGAALTGVMVAIVSRNQTPIEQSMGKQAPRNEQDAYVA